MQRWRVLSPLADIGFYRWNPIRGTRRWIGRRLSSVVLRQQLPSCVWTGLNPVSQSSIKSILLSAVRREETKSLSEKLCHTISELAWSKLTGLIDGLFAVLMKLPHKTDRLHRRSISGHGSLL
ncbi:hypothetical protein HPP92_006108 [Vanilla planifolia]|uniref:Uncharacterized protein n=1 Tax=Vanilla planifolia TaxID=51239 RepID=A0A835RI36_VANPL|nr:hypothetical protein HPP92_006108 [Vanilla planifolia]